MKYYLRDEYAEPKNYAYKIEKFAGLDASREEEQLPLNYAAYGYNVRFTAGTVREGFGVGYARIGERYLPSALPTGEGIKKLFLYKRFDRTTGERDDRLVFYSDNGKLYVAPIATSGAFTQLEATLGGNNVTFLNCEYNNKDVLWISDDRGHLLIYDGTTVQTASDTPYLSDACVYNGRVFATSCTANNVLRYSAKGDPTDWSDGGGAGKLTFPDEGGKILRAVVFTDALIVFREHAVYKYVGYPDSAVYTLTKLFFTDQKIYGDSVCVCGDKIIFLAGNTFFKCEGWTMTKVFRNISPLIESAETCAACFFDNKYFFTFSMKGNEEVGEEAMAVNNNAFFAVDVYGDELSVTKGTDVAGFIPVGLNGEKALLCRFSYGYRSFDVGMVNESGRVFSTPLKKLWRSPKSFINLLGKKKYLRKIYIRSYGQLKLSIDGDETTEYDLPQTGRTHCVYVGKNADAVGLTLTSTADKITLYGVEMEFDVKRRSVYDE